MPTHQLNNRIRAKPITMEHAADVVVNTIAVYSENPGLSIILD